MLRLLAALAIVLSSFHSLAVAASEAESHAQPIRNVLFIVADDLRANVLGCYGDQLCDTPNLDRLAGESVVYTRAYCQSPLCAPSRPSMMFSRYGRKSINRNEHRSFPQVLKDNGWHSARVGKIFHMAVPLDIVNGTDGADYPEAWSERFNLQGPEESTPGLYHCLNIDDVRTELDGRQGAGTKNRMYVAVRGEGDGLEQPDAQAAQRAIELLRANRDRPFLLAVGFVRPHYPHVAPASYFGPYPKDDMQMPRLRENDWDDIPPEGIPKKTNASTGFDKFPENQKRMWSAYYASTTFMDEQLGKVLTELEQLGLRDQTLVIFTSDHGYHLGDHEFWEKQDLHEQAIRVPLMISAPGRPPAVCESIAELADLYPTVLDLVGLDTPSACVGTSLAPTLRDPTADVREYAFTYLGARPKTRYSMRSKRWAYMQYPSGAEELYDMDHDPEQFTNLAEDPQHAAVIEACRAALEQRRKAFR